MWWQRHGSFLKKNNFERWSIKKKDMHHQGHIFIERDQIHCNPDQTFKQWHATDENNFEFRLYQSTVPLFYQLNCLFLSHNTSLGRTYNLNGV